MTIIPGLNVIDMLFLSMRDKRSISTDQKIKYFNILKDLNVEASCVKNKAYHKHIGVGEKEKSSSDNMTKWYFIENFPLT